MASPLPANAPQPRPDGGQRFERGDRVFHLGIKGIVLNVHETQGGRYHDVLTEYGPMWCHERELERVETA
jgi:hypothetical protein